MKYLPLDSVDSLLAQQGYLQADGLAKEFGSVKAVESFSMTVQKGQFAALLGPSGSGKTTVLKMVGGLIASDQGHLSINGQLVDQLPPEKRNIGFVFQNYALFPHMRIFDNVAFPLRMRHTPESEIRDKVKTIMETVRLSGHETKFPKQLSGGEQQRVALARALVFQPDLLLLDEPLSALDQKLRVQLRSELKAVQRKLGVTTVYVTHDQEEALSMADIIAVMNKGHVEQIGSPRQIYERPATKFVASFVGNTNILEGEVTGRKSPEVVSVRCGSQLVEVQGGADIRQGDRVTLGIKAEDVAISDAGQGGLNATVGEVENVVYMGQYSVYDVRVDDGVLLRATTNIGTSAQPNWKLGSEVRLSWRTEDVVLLLK